MFNWGKDFYLISLQVKVDGPLYLPHEWDHQLNVCPVILSSLIWWWRRCWWWWRPCWLRGQVNTWSGTTPLTRQKDWTWFYNFSGHISLPFTSTTATTIKSMIISINNLVSYHGDVKTWLITSILNVQKRKKRRRQQNTNVLAWVLLLATRQDIYGHCSSHMVLAGVFSTEYKTLTFCPMIESLRLYLY